MEKIPSQNAAEMIDLFPHILPRKYHEALLKKSRPCYYLEANSLRPPLVDLDLRFKTLDKFERLRPFYYSVPISTLFSQGGTYDYDQARNA